MTIEELNNIKSSCKSANDFSDLAIAYAADNNDKETIGNLLNQAETKCSLPLDYFSVANAYFVAMKDKDKALEILEENADSCFDCMEFCELGRLYFSIAGDKEKAKEYLENAAKEAKKTDEFLAVASYLGMIDGNTEIVQQLLDKAESTLKTYDDYKTITGNLITKNNLDSARNIFKKASKKVDEIGQSASYSLDVFSFFSDRDWAAEILNNVKDDAQFTKDLISLAYAYNTLGEKEIVNEIIQQAEDYAMQGDEYIELGYVFVALGSDKEKAAVYFDKGLESITDKNQLLEIGINICTTMQNNELASKFFIQAESKMTTLKDILNLASAIASYLKDKDYLKKIYDKSFSMASVYDDFKTIAVDIHTNLQNSDMTLKALDSGLKAIQKFDDFFDMLSIARQLTNDNLFYSQILKTAFSKSSNSNDKLKVAEQIFSTIDDKSFGKIVIENAEETVTSLDELKKVQQTVRTFFAEDDNWLARIDEKIKKREENQALYDEFLKREKESKSFRDFMSLNEDIILKLDDKYYSRKILSNAETMLDSDFFNIKQYIKLIDAYDKHLNDENKIAEILKRISENKVKFFFELNILIDSVKLYINQDELRNSLIDDFISGFTERLKEQNIDVSFEMLKVARLAGELDQSERVDFLLDYSENNTDDILAKAGLVVEYWKKQNTAKADRIVIDAINQCKKIHEIQTFAITLINGGYDYDKVKSFYLSVKNKFQGSEQIDWIAGLTDIFNDSRLAKKEYDSAMLSGKLPDKDLLKTSMSNRL